MRILFDTNVWLAAFLTHGFCHELVEYCLESHTLLTSEAILKECREKLSKKFKFPPSRVKENLSFITHQTERISIFPLSKAVCRDPDDDFILATAVQGKAEYLITGDRDLLILKKFEGIPIILPKEFWRLEQKSRG